MIIEWHLPPDYIVNNWTDELLALMCEKLSDRKRHESEAFENAREGRGSNKVSDKELFARGKSMIEVVNQDGNERG